MKKLTFILLAVVLAATALQSAVVTTDLIHRWTFTDGNGSTWTDSVGGAVLTGYGSFHDVYKETGGLVPGVKLGLDADTSAHGYLFCPAASLDLAGRAKVTVELVYAVYHDGDGASDYSNILTINEDHEDRDLLAPYSEGLALWKSQTQQNLYWLWARTASSGIGTGGSNSIGTNAENGALHKAAFVLDTLSETKSVFVEGLSESTVGSADRTSTDQPYDLDGFDLYLGDASRYCGEVYVVELRIYGAALSTANLNTNHTADRARYMGTMPIDVFVDNEASVEGYGTPTSPYKTLVGAWKRITEGSTIRFQRVGEYAGVLQGNIDPSADENITLLGLESDPDGVVIVPGGESYCLQVDNGVYHNRYLKFDGETTAGFLVLASGADVDSITFDQCSFVNSYRDGSGGSGLMSRAVVTGVDSCTFDEIDEHGIYLRNQDAADDYAGSWITSNTFERWGHATGGYAVQVNNESDTAYVYTGLVVERNTIQNPTNENHGGLYLAATEGVLCRFNTIDFSSVAGIHNSSGISFGSGEGRTAADDGYVYNNEITSALVGIYGGDAAGVGKSYEMRVYNNYLVDCTTDFDPDEAALYKIRNNISTGATTSFLDSYADSAGIQERVIRDIDRLYGGYGPLDGLTITASTNGTDFYPVGVRTAAQLAATNNWVPKVQTGKTGFNGWVNTLETIRAWGLLGVSMDGGGTLSDQMSLDVWHNSPHPICADSAITAKWPYSIVAEDTLQPSGVFK